MFYNFFLRRIHLFVFIFIFFHAFFFTKVIYPHPWDLPTLHGDKSGMFLKRGYSLIKDWQWSNNENAKPAIFSFKLALTHFISSLHRFKI